MKKNYLLGSVLALFGFVVVCVSCSNDDESDGLLAPFKEAFSKIYPKECVPCVGWEKENGYYVAEFTQATPASDVEVWFDQNADWCMTETDYADNYQPITLQYPKVFSEVKEMMSADMRIADVSVYNHKSGSVVLEIECENAQKKEVSYIFKDGEHVPNFSGDIRPDSPIWN